MAARSTTSIHGVVDTPAVHASIDKHLATLDTLLRLLDPDTPFQPILIGSIDLVAWQALFGEAAAAVEQQFPEFLRTLPKHDQDRLKAAGAQLFPLAQIVCGDAMIHADPRAHEFDDLPELQGLAPELVPTEEARQLIRKAIDAAEDFDKQHADQIAQLDRQLAASTVQLKHALTGRSGVLQLLKQRVAKSKKAQKDFQRIVHDVDDALTPIPDAGASWPDSRRHCSSFAVVLASQIDTRIDAILKQAVQPRRKQQTSSSAPSLASRRQTIKNTYVCARDAVTQALGGLRSLSGARTAEVFRELFADPVALLAVELARAAPTSESVRRHHRSRCIVDAIADLDERVISRLLTAQWAESLHEADGYSFQAILAGLHHLARPNDTGEFEFAFSEHALARHLSRGDFRGANPDRESSKSLDAEVRRVRRTLQHLRRIAAAFHGRLQWTPSPKKLSATASNRLWTINPLLACHPQIRHALAAAPALVERDARLRDSRPHPTKSNRTRRRNT
jgi:hypothetical protein